jgi:hypothetical protein
MDHRRTTQEYERRRQASGERRRYLQDLSRNFPPRRSPEVDRRVVERRPRPADTRNCRIQTDGQPPSENTGSQTTAEDREAWIPLIRGVAAWVARQFDAGRLLSVEDVMATLPNLSPLEAEALLVAVGEGLGCGLRSHSIQSASTAPSGGERPAELQIESTAALKSQSQPVILMETEPGLEESTPVPAKAAAACEGVPLTAATVMKATQRVMARHRRPPSRLPPGTDPAVEQQLLSLMFRGKDREADLLREKVAAEQKNK